MRVYCWFWILFTGQFGHCLLLGLDTVHYCFEHCFGYCYYGLNITGDRVLHGIFFTVITVQQLISDADVIRKLVKVRILCEKLHN
jgi:hypothetical protein